MTSVQTELQCTRIPSCNCRVCLACTCPACASGQRSGQSAGKPGPRWLREASPRSQKARGLKALVSAAVGYQRIGLTPMDALLVQSAEEAERLSGYYADGKALFMRPCPTRPRHGFVESRVATVREAAAILSEAIQADPGAEMLVMEPIRAACSGIFVPESGMLALGPGHDGATGGRPGGFMLPVLAEETPKAFREEAGITPGEHTYMEVVYASDSPDEYPGRLVQARSGPALSGASEFIPTRTTVAEVLEPTDDLLAWEATALEARGRSGVVAWVPGGTLACHAAVHCVANSVPFLTRATRPSLGEVVEPVGAAAVPFDVAEFRAGADWAHARCRTRAALRAATEAGIAIVHNAARLSQHPQWSRMLGFASMAVFVATAASCIGEARFFRGASGKRQLRVPRDEVYKRVLLYRTPHSLARVLVREGVTFPVEGGYHGGYGGWPWFYGSMEGLRLWRAMEAVDGTLALATVNRIIHMAHNSGSLLNKIVLGDVLDCGAENPGALLTSRGDVLFDLLSAPRPPQRRRRHRRVPGMVSYLEALPTEGCCLMIRVAQGRAAGRSWATLCLDPTHTGNDRGLSLLNSLQELE